MILSISRLFLFCFSMTEIFATRRPLKGLGAVILAAILLCGALVWGGHPIIALLWLIVYVGGISIVFIYVIFFSHHMGARSSIPISWVGPMIGWALLSSTRPEGVAPSMVTMETPMATIDNAFLLVAENSPILRWIFISISIILLVLLAFLGRAKISPKRPCQWE